MLIVLFVIELKIVISYNGISRKKNVQPGDKDCDLGTILYKFALTQSSIVLLLF